MILLLLLACEAPRPAPVASPPPPPEPPDLEAPLFERLGLPPTGEEREIEHELDFPSPAAADEALARLAAMGLKVEAQPLAGEAWSLRARERRLWDKATARARREELEALCAELGGQYEGWTPLP